MTPIEQISDTALMCRVREGDESAFESLHARYQQKTLNFFYVLSHNRHTANDLCQETFLRIWRVRKRYQATGNFAAYLFAIARLIWFEHQRQQQKTWRLGYALVLDDTVDVAASADCAPDVQAARSEVETRIWQALEELPEEQRMVFVLRNIQGLSLEDIAAALDCPVNTVRSRKILAVTKLRHLLAKVFAPVAEQAI